MNQTDLLARTIELAVVAKKQGNYPIGALIADKKGKIIVESYNSSFTDHDPSAHAEIKCLRQAGSRLSQLVDLVLYSSLEPCFGCSFFLCYTNIRKVIWALSDPYKGGFSDLQSFSKTKDDFAEFEVVIEPSNQLKEQSRKLLHDFFVEKNKLKAAEAFKV